MKILAFAGSNSKNSINKMLLKYALSKLDNATVDLIDINNYQMPIYSIDIQTENGFPKLAKDFYEKVQNCDGLFVSLAEHNGNFAVSLKNILDWVSRIDMAFLKNKKMILLSTSPGSYGGKNVLEVGIKYFGTFASGEIITNYSLPFFNDNFKNGEIVNPELKNELLDKIKLFEKSFNS